MYIRVSLIAWALENMGGERNSNQPRFSDICGF
jgi:hypothetical protein